MSMTPRQKVHLGVAHGQLLRAMDQIDRKRNERRNLSFKELDEVRRILAAAKASLEIAVGLEMTDAATELEALTVFKASAEKFIAPKD